MMHRLEQRRDRVRPDASQCRNRTKTDPVGRVVECVQQRGNRFLRLWTMTAQGDRGLAAQGWVFVFEVEDAVGHGIQIEIRRPRLVKTEPDQTVGVAQSAGLSREVSLP